MASTYSTNLGIELIGTGDQSGTWGATTNTNLGTLLEQSIAGYATQAVADSASPTVLTIANGASSTGRNAVIALTGALTLARVVEVPAKTKSYIFYNATTGGFAVTVKVTGQTGVSVPNGTKAIVYCDGTDVRNVLSNVTVDSSGNVGIGTSSPSTSFEVTNTSTTATITSTATSGYSALGLRNTGTSGRSWQVAVGGSATGVAGSYYIYDVTAASERMRIDSSGNVGIGTSSPAAKLDVSTSINLGLNYLNIAYDVGGGSGWVSGYNTTYNAGVKNVNTGTLNSIYYTSDSVRVYTNASAAAGTAASERMRIDSSGNVGIGTSSPSTLFEVANTSTTATITSTATSGYSALGLRNTGTSGRSWQVAVGGSATGVAGSYYIYDVTAASERMRIDSSGNVGIGTASPSAAAKLTLAGTSTNSALLVYNNTAAANTGLFGSVAAITGAGTSNDLAIGAFGSSNMTFYTNAAERMRIDSSGNVGIGTSSPSTLFEVANTSTTATITSTATSGYSVLSLRNTGTSGRSWQVAVGGSATAVAGSYYVYDATAAAVRMLIDSSGNVGIGTSSPNASAILDAQSTTKGVCFPNMTTTQKNAISSPAAGLVVFDTTLAKLCVYSGSAWQTVTSV